MVYEEGNLTTCMQGSIRAAILESSRARILGNLDESILCNPLLIGLPQINYDSVYYGAHVSHL